MKSILQALEGKKTFIVAGATILYCVIGVALHFMTIPIAASFIGTTGSIAMLRAGIGKAQDALEVILEVLKIIGQNQGSVTTTVVQPSAPAETGTPVQPETTPVVAPTTEGIQ